MNKTEDKFSITRLNHKNEITFGRIRCFFLTGINNALKIGKLFGENAKFYLIPKNATNVLILFIFVIVPGKINSRNVIPVKLELTKVRAGFAGITEMGVLIQVITKGEYTTFTGFLLTIEWKFFLLVRGS